MKRHVGTGNPTRLYSWSGEWVADQYGIYKIATEGDAVDFGGR